MQGVGAMVVFHRILASMTKECNHFSMPERMVQFRTILWIISGKSDKLLIIKKRKKRFQSLSHQIASLIRQILEARWRVQGHTCQYPHIYLRVQEVAYAGSVCRLAAIISKSFHSVLFPNDLGEIKPKEPKIVGSKLTVFGANKIKNYSHTFWIESNRRVQDLFKISPN